MTIEQGGEVCMIKRLVTNGNVINPHTIQSI